MKKTIFLLFVLGMIFGVLLTCNNDAFAQKKTKVVAKPAVKEFDISASRLPPNFSGHNDRIADICKSFPTYQMKKGEFETEEEFKQRKANALSATKIYAFSHKNNPPRTEGAKMLLERFGDTKASEPKIRYKIDEQAFMIDIDSVIVNDYKSVSKGSYVGQNAFGAKTVVRKFDVWEYAADIYVTLSIKLPVPVEAAKVLKDDLRVLMVVKPTGVIHHEVFHRATLDFPSDIFLRWYRLNIDEPIDVWVYNYKTGEILYKRSDESKKTAISQEEKGKTSQ